MKFSTMMAMSGVALSGAALVMPAKADQTHCYKVYDATHCKTWDGKKLLKTVIQKPLDYTHADLIITIIDGKEVKRIIRYYSGDRSSYTDTDYTK